MGVPDPLRGERVKAFVVLNRRLFAQPGTPWPRRSRISSRTRLAAHEYPREVAFIQSLPMTATGKIMRRELREAG